ncbi:MAG: ABC transporter ATP-binding protein, partial [Acidimicrobiia bacterium]
RDAGQTVFMSSHVLSEVQTSADRAGIIRKGELITIDEVDELRARALRHVRVVFDGTVSVDDFSNVPNVTDVTVEDGVLRCRLVGEVDGLIKALAGHHVLDLIAEEPQLEELFFHYYTGEDDHAG